jgi:hypothetical protein
MNTFLENQNWRYATKKFDPSKKIAAKRCRMHTERSYQIRTSLLIVTMNHTKSIVLRILSYAQLKPTAWSN